MTSPKVCPSCGRSEPLVEFVGAFCTECDAARHSIQPPDNLELTLCPSCRRVRIPEWSEITDAALAAWLARKLKVGAEKPSGKFVWGKKEVEADLRFEQWSAGRPVERRVRVTIPLNKILCIDCARRSGGYYEAILQFRGERTTAERWLKRAANIINQVSFIPKVEEKKEGWDLYVGERKAALKALQALDQHFTVSRKLVGRKDGRNLYRSTYCVRAGEVDSK